MSFNPENLKKIGIESWGKIHYNCDYETLYQHELNCSDNDFSKGHLTAMGAVAVDTGRFTGRSPRDKYIVRQPDSEKNVWWSDEGSDNKPVDEKTWNILRENSLKRVNGKDLYVMDLFCGANKDTRLKIRLVTEIAWKAHFAKNMFIRPTDEELQGFEPDWTIIDSCKTDYPNYKDLGLNSEVYVVFNIQERTTIIGGTWYGGEIKKGIFTMMNYFLPLKEIGAFHCSANKGKNGETALFFGLSGTGKTTLSTDPARELIGDDEHGWDNDGVFNFEGGCYAKCIDLSQEKEPDIYNAIKKNALLENVDIDSSGKVDFASTSKTQNTRVSYPIYHIENIVKPVSRGTHPNNVIFLTCDAFGVLPPVAKLDDLQAQYQYLSGYTAKVAGTEIGVKEPTATFSPCFGGPFLLVHPTKYAEILGKKMKQHGSNAYLVNTGWSGGGYGVGSRMELKITRKIIHAILDGSIEQSEWETFPVFNFQIPKTIAGIESSILNPKNTWNNKDDYSATLQKLAGLFSENFSKYSNNEHGKLLAGAGPAL